jgi:hypothetical protein
MTTTYFALLERLSPGGMPQPPANLPVDRVGEDERALVRRHLAEVMNDDDQLAVHLEQLAFRFGITPRRAVWAFPPEQLTKAITSGLDVLDWPDLLRLGFDPNALCALRDTHAAVPELKVASRAVGQPLDRVVPTPLTKLGSSHAIDAVNQSNTPLVRTGGGTIAQHEIVPQYDSDAYNAIKDTLIRVIATALRNACTGAARVKNDSPRKIVDSAAATLFHQPTPEDLSVFYSLAASKMRQFLRREAQENLNRFKNTTLQGFVNIHGSIGIYAGGWDGAIARDNVWQELDRTNPGHAEMIALYCFAGRTPLEISRRLNVSQNQVEHVIIQFEKQEAALNGTRATEL